MKEKNTIVLYRASAKLKQDALAKALNVTVSSVSRLEKNVTKLRVSQLRILAKTFDITAEDLLVEILRAEKISFVDPLLSLKTNLAVCEERIQILQEQVVNYILKL